MSRNSVILIKYHFLLIFICSNHLKIIRPESVLINFLNTVDKLDGSCISIFCKERNSSLASFNGFKYIADGLIHKERILNFILLLFGRFLVQAFCNLSVIWGVWAWHLLLIFALVLLLLLFLVLFVVAADLWNGHRLIEGWFHVLSLFRVSKWQVIVIELRLYIKLIKLIIHGVIRFFYYYDSFAKYQKGMGFSSSSFASIATFFVSWALWTTLKSYLHPSYPFYRRPCLSSCVISYKFLFKSLFISI